MKNGFPCLLPDLYYADARKVEESLLWTVLKAIEDRQVQLSDDLTARKKNGDYMVAVSTQFADEYARWLPGRLFCADRSWL